jgi:ribosome-binding protein aMBF1 (putative translation factor)
MRPKTHPSVLLFFAEYIPLVHSGLVLFGLMLFGIYDRRLDTDVDKSISSHDYRIFLRELRAARKQIGLTQIDMASRLGETQSFVSKCERGERRLDIVEVRAFCQAMGLPLLSFVRKLEPKLSGKKAGGKTNRN